MPFEFTNQFWRDRKEYSLPGDALQKRTVAMLNAENLSTDSAEEPKLYAKEKLPAMFVGVDSDSIRCVLPSATSFSWWVRCATRFLQPALAGFLRSIEKPAKAGSMGRLVFSDAASLSWWQTDVGLDWI